MRAQQLLEDLTPSNNASEGATATKFLQLSLFDIFALYSREIPRCIIIQALSIYHQHLPDGVKWARLSHGGFPHAVSPVHVDFKTTIFGHNRFFFFFVVS